MFKILTLDKFQLGKLLIPKNILSFNYEKELTSIYEKLYNSKFNYLIITNIFIISLVVNLFFYFFQQTIFKSYVDDILGNNILYISFYTFFSWTIQNLIFYYVFLFVYFFLKEFAFKMKVEEIEKDSPEFLDNIISNLKGGITFEKTFYPLLKNFKKNMLLPLFQEHLF